MGQTFASAPPNSPSTPSERANFDRQYPRNGALSVLQKSKYLSAWETPKTNSQKGARVNICTDLDFEDDYELLGDYKRA